MIPEFDEIVQGPRLYKRGVKGEVRVWRMEMGSYTDHTDGKTAYTRVVSGILHGKETFSGWSLAKPKNVGKKNATDSFTQAQAEMEAEYKKKRDRGYFDDISEIDAVPFVKPMLAQDWKKREKRVSFESDTVFAQPKLDGIRCIVRSDGLWSRSGKEIVACPHIMEAMAPIFQRKPDMVFDGELYNHALNEDFNEITSIVRKSKLKDADLKKSRQLIQYHVYDMVDEDRPFSKRFASLSNMINQDPSPFVHIVQTKQVPSKKILDDLYGRWLSDGYEGQIIRLDAPYENKRSNTLMKRKEFITDEFSVVAMHEGEGNWRGGIKRFTLAHPKTGQEFGAGVRGSFESLSKLLEEGRTPKWATVRYFTPTPDGVPRFPVVIDYGFDNQRDD